MEKAIIPISRGEEIDLYISGITHSGNGVGRVQGIAVFVPGVVPGDKVRAEVAELKKNYAVARLLEITVPSAFRRDPECPRFSGCGGCRLQNVDYQEQVRLKTTLVKDSLSRIAGLDGTVVREAIGMADPRHYRNKAHFQIEYRSGVFSLGFYQEGTHTLSAFFGGEDTSGCLLVDRDINIMALTIEKLLNRYGKSAEAKKSRFFRHVVIRKGFYTGELMVVLVTESGEWPAQTGFVREILSGNKLTSLIRNINSGSPGIIMGRENMVLAGQGHITDRLGDLSFIISPSSFYQVNPAQTKVLYGKALEYADLGPDRDKTVVDAYSGVGTIALFMAGSAQKIYALEVVPGSVEDARRNAAINSVNNIEFLAGEAEKLLPSLTAQGLRLDVAVLDPPRRGCHPDVLEALANIEVPRIVYVSCDPGTLARDLSRLTDRGYRVEEVQPVDMFPWTQHVECVAKIGRR